MTGIHFVLLGLAAFGFLPLAVIVYKKRSVQKILATGNKATAMVYNVQRLTRSATEVVYYHFFTPDGVQSVGSLTIQSGTYKPGDVLEVYYQPGNPKKNTVSGAWGSKAFVVFGIVIAAFVLFAVYKMWEMVENGSM